MTDKVKSHTTPIQIRFKDIDDMGHVNHANHLTYFEIARIRYFEEIVGGTIDWENEGIILAHISASYKLPVYLTDKIHVRTYFIKAGTTSFDLGYDLIRTEKDGSETICATGTSTLVCFNYKEKKSIPIPQAWKLKMNTVA